MIPVYRPWLTDTERAYVSQAVESSWISSKGEFIDRFERGFADFVQAEHGIGTCNGTVSLHLILAALGLGPGDEVVVPTFTYVASVNAIAYTGATPVFVDSDPQTWNLDPTLLEAAVTPRTRAIMPVHLYGAPTEMTPVLALAEGRGLVVVEDAAEAHGAEYRGRKVGALGTAGSFSFFGNKIITTGEGGMVVTNDAALAERCRHLRGQGVDPARTYWHDVIGFNYRMTNLAAAIGVAQLERVEEILRRKRQIAQAYEERLRDVPGVELQSEPDWATNVYWMVSILVDPGRREALMAHLAARGVDSRPFFHPAHTLPMYREPDGRYPVAEWLGASGLNLPSFPELTPAELDTVCEAITDFFAS